MADVLKNLTEVLEIIEQMSDEEFRKIFESVGTDWEVVASYANLEKSILNNKFED